MESTPQIETLNLNLYYDKFQAIDNVNIKIPAQNITAVIGPSGCGKSTLLRCFNRMNDLAEKIKIDGKIIINNKNILASDTDLILLRRQVGMVFQRPNVFDLSIYQNLLFGLRIHRMLNHGDDAMEIIRNGLEHVALWDELKDKLKKNARSLSLEQQQRLCIARVLILKPGIILLDEPCSALDPISTNKIEELLRVLREEYTLVIVTHNMQQAARVSDYTGFMYLGKLVEFGETTRVFTNPTQKLTENYIGGRFG